MPTKSKEELQSIMTIVVRDLKENDAEDFILIAPPEVKKMVKDMIDEKLLSYQELKIWADENL